MEKATAEMLIARKLQGEYDKTKVKVVELPKLGFSLELKKPELRKVLELLDETQRDNSSAGNLRFNQEIVYSACNMLHNKELQEQFACTEPPDIVLKILDDDIGELNRLADIVSDFFGMSELDDAAKN